MNPAETSTAPKKMILLIDDELSLLRVHQRGLTTLGYHVLTASSGEEGLHLLAENAIDLVVLDMLMPRMDGVETLRTIRQRTPEQKVMILSGYAEPEKVDAVKAMGVLAYLKKPLTLKSLAATIDEALAGHADPEVS